MSTSDYTLPTSQITGPTYTVNLLEALRALVSNNSDTQEPPVLFDWMTQVFTDPNSGVSDFRIYNPGDPGQNNDEWVTLLPDLSLPAGGLVDITEINPLKGRVTDTEDRLDDVEEVTESLNSWQESRANTSNTSIIPEGWTGETLDGGVGSNGNFNPGTFRWVCPATGAYIYSARFRVASNTANLNNIAFSYAGQVSPNILIQAPSVSNLLFASSNSTVLNLTVGQVLYPQLFINTTDGTGTRTLEFLNLYIKRIA